MKTLPKLLLCLLGALLGMAFGPSTARAAFGLTTATDYYTVDTGAGLVFKIRRTDNGSSTQSPGDIMSLVYNGTEYQDQSRGSQVNSGFDYIYTDTAAVTVSAATVGTDYVKITVVSGDPSLTGVLTHYYMAHRGEPCIYMATHFTAEPTGQALCRYILRLPSTTLTNGPAPSDVRNNTGAIESADIFGMADGTTRSKHYSNMRLKDWSYIGANNSATAPTAGIWIVRDNNEGGSGGPFFRCLLNQCGTDQEITYIVNYGEGQTEAFRPGVLNGYTLVCTDGSAPGAVDTSFFADMGLTGYVAPGARGSVACPGIGGRDTACAYTVGFANATAQYWTDASATDGSFTMAGMIPGTYTMQVYKNELSVYTNSSVTVAAGGTATLGAITLTGDPSTVAPLWRIGNWDGTPGEFLYSGLVTHMHPSDVRITGTAGNTAAWAPATYVVGTSAPATGIPCYQWKTGVNGTQAIQFNLTSSQLVASTIRIGITTAYAGGRPNVAVNSWSNTNLPSASTQPDSRTLTVGTYRGNNTMYTYAVPASALVAGTNTLYVSVISGSSGTTYLSPGYSLDCIEMYQGTAKTLAVPGAPANLGGVTSQNPRSATLFWDAVTGAASYEVRRAATAGGTYAVVATGLTTASWTDTDVAADGTYYYRVSAVNTSGTGLPAAISLNPSVPPRSPATLSWKGDVSAVWDTATANWTYSGGKTVFYYPDDVVRFDDTGAATSVTLSGTLSPAAVTVDATQNYAFLGGTLSGGGSLAKSGSGTLTLSSAHTYTGGTTVTGGTLALAAGGSVTGSVAFSGAGTFAMAAAGTNFPSNGLVLGPGVGATLSSASLSNGYSGSVSGPADATLTLSGPVSFSVSGSAQCANFSGTVSIPSGSQLRFSSTGGPNGNGGANATFLVNGTLSTRNAGGTGGVVLGALSGSGSIKGQSNTPNGSVTYFVGGKSASTTFGGSIANTSTSNTVALTKLGTGALTLSGANTYTGATAVSGGSLLVTGSLGTTAVSVASGATAGGTGSLGGNLALSSGARLALGVGAAATKGLTVAGTSTLNGAITVVPALLGGTLAPGTYTLLTYAGTLGGSPAFTWSDTTGSGYSATFDTSTAGQVRITLYTPLQTWRQAYFGTTAATGNAANTADPDGDGLPNLLEYALGTSPLAASGAPVQSPMANGLLQIVFNRIADPALTYTVQASGDLVNWTDIWTSTGAANTAGPVAVQDNAVAGSARRFLRLQLTTASP